MQQNQIPQRVLITGGSSGIGFAIAKKFSSSGSKIMIADIQSPPEGSGNILFRKCDVGNPVQIDDLFSWTRENMGDPDLLVLNAGRGIKEKLTEGDPEKWRKIIDTNLMGALRCIRAFVPGMVEKKKGHVVFISSVSSAKPHPYGGVYSASKTALEVIAETLRLETIPHVNVTVISPGITDTNFFRNEVSGGTSVEQMGIGAISPDDIAEDVFYAVNKRNGTSINKIITRPIGQEF